MPTQEQNAGLSSDASKVIVVQNVVARYGPKLVLDDVSLEVLRGETVAIVGVSGCGKTTLLRHMVGLLKPTSGTVLVNGKDITKMSEEEMIDVRKKIGMLFQTAALWNSMTVGDNVALSLREHTMFPPEAIVNTVRSRLELVGLPGAEALFPAQLSEGMRKRAGLARALAMDPDILFLDEPTSGLDPLIAAEIDALLAELKKVLAKTMVIITHKLTSAFELADRIVLLNERKVIASGTPEDIRRSAVPFVKRFVAGKVDAGERSRLTNVLSTYRRAS